MQWLDLTLDVFFPQSCPACGAPPARTGPLSLCTRCDEALWHLPRALPLGPGQRTAVALGAYEGPLGRALLHAACGSDPDRFAAMDGRFSSPVMPGETLSVNIWQNDDGTANFRTFAGDRVVLDNGVLTTR